MSTVNESKPHTPTIVTVVHPANEAQFREVAVSKSDLRQAKSEMQMTCSYCTKPNADAAMWRCARCKIAMYCSYQCQRKDWPEHKRNCTETTSMTPRMVTSLVANEVLHLYLQIALVLLFNIATPPEKRERSSTAEVDIVSRMQNLSLVDVTPNAGSWDEVPFIAKCKVGVQLCDMNNVVKILSGKLTDTECASIEGMLQLSELVPSEFSAPPIPRASSSSASAPAPPPEPPFQGKTRLEPWKEAKAAAERMRASGQPSVPKLPVCLIDFALPDAKQLITSCIIIQPVAILLVKEGLGFSLESAVLPIKKDIPLSVESCLTCINAHIRDDKKNQIQLRTTMTKELIENLFHGRGRDEE